MGNGDMAIVQGGDSGQTPYMYFDRATTNVGIGNFTKDGTQPTKKLDVDGYVKGRSGLCIGNDCRTS